jgi:hypothetical protein
VSMTPCAVYQTPLPAYRCVRQACHSSSRTAPAATTSSLTAVQMMNLSNQAVPVYAFLWLTAGAHQQQHRRWLLAQLSARPAAAAAHPVPVLLRSQRCTHQPYVLSQEYKEVFEPLLLEEAGAQVLRGIEEGCVIEPHPAVVATCSKVQRAGANTSGDSGPARTQSSPARGLLLPPAMLCGVPTASRLAVRGGVQESHTA